MCALKYTLHHRLILTVICRDTNIGAKVVKISLTQCFKHCRAPRGRNILRKLKQIFIATKRGLNISRVSGYDVHLYSEHSTRWAHLSCLWFSESANKEWVSLQGQGSVFSRWVRKWTKRDGGHCIEKWSSDKRSQQQINCIQLFIFCEHSSNQTFLIDPVARHA